MICSGGACVKRCCCAGSGDDSKVECAYSLPLLFSFCGTLITDSVSGRTASVGADDEVFSDSMNGFDASVTAIGCICLSGFTSMVLVLDSDRAEAKRMDRGFCPRYC